MLNLIANKKYRIYIKAIALTVSFIFLFENIGYAFSDISQNKNNLRAPFTLNTKEGKERFEHALLLLKTLEATEVHKDKMAMSHSAARYFVTRLKEELEKNKNILVVFPTGRTPEYFYELLPKCINELIGKDNWARLVSDGTIQFANLDEYVFPIPKGVSIDLRHPKTLTELVNNLEKIFGSKLGSLIAKESYGYYIRQIYSKLGIPESSVFFINSLHENPDKAALDYEQIFTNARSEGRKIIRVYGIGPAEEENGENDVHLAFIKHGTPFTQRTTHYAELTNAAKTQNREVFKKIAQETGFNADVLEVPDHAISTGYPDPSDIIIVLASGKDKALSMQLIMSNEPTPEIPATYIHKCDDVRVFVDEEAFLKVKEVKPTVAMTIDENKKAEIEVNLYGPLKKLTGGKRTVKAVGGTVLELIADLEKQYKGIGAELLDEGGSKLKQHINILINEAEIRFLQGLDTQVKKEDKISIIVAMTGGGYIDDSKIKIKRKIKFGTFMLAIPEEILEHIGVERDKPYGANKIIFYEINNPANRVAYIRKGNAIYIEIGEQIIPQGATNTIALSQRPEFMEFYAKIMGTKGQERAMAPEGRLRSQTVITGDYCLYFPEELVGSVELFKNVRPVTMIKLVDAEDATNYITFRWDNTKKVLYLQYAGEPEQVASLKGKEMPERLGNRPHINIMLCEPFIKFYDRLLKIPPDGEERKTRVMQLLLKRGAPAEKRKDSIIMGGIELHLPAYYDWIWRMTERKLIYMLWDKWGPGAPARFAAIVNANYPQHYLILELREGKIIILGTDRVIEGRYANLGDFEEFNEFDATVPYPLRFEIVGEDGHIGIGQKGVITAGKNGPFVVVRKGAEIEDKYHGVVTTLRERERFSLILYDAAEFEAWREKLPEDNLKRLLWTDMWDKDVPGRPREILRITRLPESGYVFQLDAEGLRWSDGKPVIVEDTVFNLCSVFAQFASENTDKHAVASSALLRMPPRVRKAFDVKPLWMKVQYFRNKRGRIVRKNKTSAKLAAPDFFTPDREEMLIWAMLRDLQKEKGWQAARDKLKELQDQKKFATRIAEKIAAGKGISVEAMVLALKEAQKHLNKAPRAILDAGSGPLALRLILTQAEKYGLEFFKEADPFVVSQDISPDMLKAGLLEFEKLKATKKINGEQYVKPLHKLVVEHGSMDFVYSGFSLHHLKPKDCTNAFIMFHNALKQNGLLVIVTPTEIPDKSLKLVEKMGFDIEELANIGTNCSLVILKKARAIADIKNNVIKLGEEVGDAPKPERIVAIASSTIKTKRPGLRIKEFEGNTLMAKLENRSLAQNKKLCQKLGVRQLPENIKALGFSQAQLIVLAEYYGPPLLEIVNKLHEFKKAEGIIMPDQKKTQDNLDVLFLQKLLLSMLALNIVMDVDDFSSELQNEYKACCDLIYKEISRVRNEILHESAIGLATVSRNEQYPWLTDIATKALRKERSRDVVDDEENVKQVVTYEAYKLVLDRIFRKLTAISLTPVSQLGRRSRTNLKSSL